MSKATYIIIRENKNKGFKTFYERYSKKLFSYSITHLKLDEDIAWDLIYKTFEKIIEKINDNDFENETKFGSFVLASFLNNFRNHYKNTRNNIQYSYDENKTLTNNLSDDYITETSDSSELKSLKEELEKLQDWERMLLLLKAQHMPYSEIAKYIDKPENQLKVYYARLKKKIMNKILSKKEVTNE